MSVDAEKRRAQTVDELHQKMMAMFLSAEGEPAPFEPQPTDVIISPFAKCGTTWLQQIFHQLRTGGDEDYDDISRVVPWIETAPMLGLDLSLDQKAEPRGFKSHLGYTDIPKGARYIVSLRDPRDALVSMYKFMEGWFTEPGAISPEAFAIGNFMHGERRGYWKHLVSWWEQRDNPDVLLLCYEHMLAEPETAIRRVADFCGIVLTEDLLALVKERSSIAYMLEHKDKFDDLMMRELSERAANLPPGSDSAKVREGKRGGYGGMLPDHLLEELAEIWRTDVTPSTGLDSYDDVLRCA